MLTLQAYKVRNERLIAMGRAGFAVLALLAIYIDPLQPALHGSLAYAVLGAYFVWALVTARFAQSSMRLEPYRQLAIHVIDVATIAVLMVLTESETSPFFIFFTFALLTAALRWSWPGVAATTVAVLVIFIGVSTAFGGQTDQTFLLVRSGYLTILAAMLALITSNAMRLRREFSRLSDIGEPTGHSLPVAQVLDYVAGVFDTPRVILVWSDGEEPWMFLGIRDAGTTTVLRETFEKLPATVVADLDEASFLSWDARNPEATLIYQLPQRFLSWHGMPIDPSFVTRFDIGAVLSVPVLGKHFTGRIFVLDPIDPSSDEILVAQLVAQQLAARLDLHRMMAQLQTLSATEERVRLARDLHDGIMQFLAGAGLQLQDIRRLLDKDPNAAQKRIEELQQTLSSEQRILRGFIDDLKPTSPPQSDTVIDLADWLGSLVPQLELQWNLPISVSAPPEAQLSPRLAHHLHYLVSEAAANARRHGGASKLAICIQMGKSLEMSISDDGRGFPFQGRMGHDDLLARGLMPVMLRERVRDLGGRIVITSSTAGARIELSLPLVEGERSWR